MDTFAAQRLAKNADTHPVSAGICIIDTGYGDGTNGQYDNKLSVDFEDDSRILKGVNLSVSGALTANRDLTGDTVKDLRDSSDHGSAVIHLASGNGRRFLGTGKDCKVVPYKYDKTFALGLQDMAIKDALKRNNVDIVSMSFSLRLKNGKHVLRMLDGNGVEFGSIVLDGQTEILATRDNPNPILQTPKINVSFDDFIFDVEAVR